MKQWMAMLLAAAMLLTMTAGALADGDEAEITAQGSAQITAAPDVVSITANASVQAATVSEAQTQMSAIIAAVTDGLKALGLTEEDFVTTNYTYYPAYDYSTGNGVINGYQANHTLRITCRDTKALDAVITTITENGMTEIYDVSYDISTRSQLYRDALALAVAAAEEKATKMAAAGGLTITGIEQIAENESYGADYGAYREADALASSGAIDTGIRSGSVTVSANVTVVYEAAK